MGSKALKDADDDEVRGSLRRCVATRRELAPDDLIRFVADPAGEIVPDVACKLPGRGVWVACERDAVRSAVKSNAFAKGLKRQVKAAEDLPERIDALFEARLVSALSLANKAGLVVTGAEKVEKLLDSGRAVAILHGSDGTAEGRRKLDRKYSAIQRDKEKPSTIVDWLTIEQLSLAMGRSNVVHAGLIQGGATKTFLGQAERLRRYRSGLNVS
ncbi:MULTISPECIES: RNA-binding protein [Hyphomicrobium]|uniref:Putative transcription terminating protein n=1 Tax=Hyphomicrobium sulfonivorans TaxID=121290 RepID=A0A109BEH5_HYPSL|nr:MULTISPECIES: RNA-binding protein [Hyphomicrobium]KWT67070.1 putative transcription terminating protein [Hyphomicrobium sulfonivorans]MDH4983115.1 RNA-binding protein [Hyphomicrobium sp. D-2]